MSEYEKLLEKLSDDSKDDSKTVMTRGERAILSEMENLSSCSLFTFQTFDC